MKYLPGTVVKLNNLQKASWYLYQRYLQDSPLLICPCHLKHGVHLIVLDHFDNGVVLLQVKNSTALTMVFQQDLKAVYEPKLNEE